VIFTSDDAQADAARRSRAGYQKRLTAAGFGQITTEILPLANFYYAEDYHQQYLAKNPGGYCGIGGTGVSCPTGLATQAASMTY
jgi:peptide-methionine (S)-S-oxide reductase